MKWATLWQNCFVNVYHFQVQSVGRMSEKHRQVSVMAAICVQSHSLHIICMHCMVMMPSCKLTSLR